MAGGHRLPKGAKTNRSGSGRRGSHRAKRTRPEPYAWLGASAVTLGLGAALASGTGVAYADDGATGSTSTSSQSSTPTGQSSSENDSSSPNDSSTTGPQTTNAPEESTEDDTGIDAGLPVPEEADTTKKNTRGTHVRGAKSVLQNRLSAATAASEIAKTPEVSVAATEDSLQDPGAPQAGTTSTTPEVASSPSVTTYASTSSTTSLAGANQISSSAAAAADPAPVPKAIAVPVLKFVGGILNLFGVNTNSPLPQLDVGLAAAWTWFRQLQTEWGIAPPTGVTATPTEPDPETGTVTGFLSANNPSGLALTYTVAIDPLLGEVTLGANGAFSYTPSEAARLAAIIAPLSDIFTVTVSNGIASNYALVTVPIGATTAGTPGIPATVSQSTNTTTGLVTGQVGSTGPAGHTLTYQVLTSTLGGQLTFNTATGEYTYQPSALAMALAGLGIGPVSDVFTVVAKNGSLTSLPGIITVPITAGNATPGTPVSVSQSTNPATGLVTGQLGSNDPAGQTLSYDVLTSTLGGTLTLNSNTGAYTYQPSALAMALAGLGIGPVSDVCTVVASNGVLTSLPAIITVPITAVDATPSAPTTVSQSTNPATGLVTGSVGSTDPAGQPLTYNVITSTLGGTLTFNSQTGGYTYQPSALAMALAGAGIGPVSDVFTVVASNGVLTSMPTIITVPITAANGKPGTPVGGSQTTNAGSGLVTGSVSSTDPIGQGVTYEVITSTIAGTLNFNGATGAYTYTPSAAARTLASAGVTTPDVFTVVARNAAGTSSIATITVPIAPNPAAPSTPTKTNQAVNSTSGLVTGKIVSTDPNGLPLTYTLTLGGIQGNYTVSTNGDFTFQPSTAARTASWAAGGNLNDVFTVTVSNGYSSSSAIITVPVSPKRPF